MNWEMETDTQSRSERNRNRLMLLMTRLRVTAVLVGLWLSDALFHVWTVAALRFSTPRKSVVTLTLALLIALPTMLFMHERSLRIRQESQLRYVTASVASENSALKHTLQELVTERFYLRSLLLDAGYQVETPRELHIKVVTTGYSSSTFETDETPYITASNTITRPGIIALSRDLLKPYTPDAPFAFGDRVWLDGYGEFIVEDSMHRRWQRSADIWFPSRNQALRFGRQELYLSKINNANAHALMGMNALDEAN